MKTYNTVLTIAGFDGSGGAGIQADLKVFTMLKCYAMSVLTALPIQNTCGVNNIFELPIRAVEQQIDAIFTDIKVNAVKIGMLFTTDIIELVAKALKKYNAPNIVLDPVMIAKSGHALLKQDCIECLIDQLVPISNIITPNIPEAEMLAKTSIENDEQTLIAAKKIQSLGVKNILLKGGHRSEDTCRDLFLSENKITWLEAPKINTKNTHGTGCTLSAAIAAYLARDFSLADSVQYAKKYLYQAIRSGSQYQLGYGSGPVHHNYLEIENVQ